MNFKFLTLLLLVAIPWAFLPGLARAQEEAQTPIAKVYGANLPPSDYYLPRNTLVEIEIMDTLDGARLSRSDTFNFRVLGDVKGDGGVVVRAGTTGKGIVMEARTRGKFGPARLHLDFGEVPSVEGRAVKLGFSLAAQRANPRVGSYETILGGYFQGEDKDVRLEAGCRVVTSVEFPYGTRHIEAGESGVKYRLFSDEPVNR